jgi:hypothetical protein
VRRRDCSLDHTGDQGGQGSRLVQPLAKPATTINLP